ncbi:MAG: hypothetical protein V3W14_03735 [Candidatus Neomarinimicrobiota bacterium]
MKVLATFLFLVAANTASGQTTSTDTSLIEKPLYKGTVLMGTGDGFVNITGEFRLKTPAFMKDYNAQPFLSIGYLYGSKSGESEDNYFEGLVVALEAHKQSWSNSRGYSLVTYLGAGLPLAGGAPDPDEELPKGQPYLLTGGVKLQKSMFELDARLRLIRGWPLPHATAFLTMNAGVRSKTFINMPLYAAMGFAVLGAIALVTVAGMAQAGL